MAAWASGDTKMSKKEQAAEEARRRAMQGRRPQSVGMVGYKKGGAALTKGEGKGAAAGAPKAAPRVKSGGMRPASLKMAAGGVAKYRKAVTDPAGKPKTLPTPPKVPVNKGAMRKGKNAI